MAEIKAEIKGVAGVLESAIEAAMVEALAGKSDAVIQNIVKLSLSEQDRYTKQTPISQAIRQTIRQEAIRQLDAWIEKNQGVIVEAVAEALEASGMLSPQRVGEEVVKELNRKMGIQLDLFAKRKAGKAADSEDDD